MRITSDKFEISADESIAWQDVKRLRLINDNLALVLDDGRVVELRHLRPGTIDMAFRAYENYIREHPHDGHKHS